MNMPITLLTASVLGASTTAFAGDPLVWDNGDIYVDPVSVGVWAFLGSEISSTGYDEAIADDFMLGQDTFITSLQWSGAEWTGGIPDAFVIEFYGSDPSGTTPTHGLQDPSKTALASFFVDIGDVDVTPLDIWPGSDPEPHFQLAFDLPLPFIANGGELYWVSIQSYHEGGGTFGWIMSESVQLNILVTTEEGAWETYEFGENSYVGDLAFKLYGTPVPGPGALVILGVGALALRRRTRRGRTT